MAQSTAAFSLRNLKIYYSTAASTGPWTDASGYSNELVIEGGERAIGETQTYDGDTPIVTEGKRAGVTLTAKVVFTEDATSPYEALRPYYEGGTAVYVKYAPKGSTAGNYAFTTSAAFIEQLLPPGGNAKDPEAGTFSAVFHCASVTKGTVS